MKAPFISVRFSHSLVRLYTAHDINRILHYATGKVESRTIKARKEARSLPLPAQINRCVYIEEDEGSSHETFTRESRGASLIELFVRRRKQRWEPSSQRVTLPAYWLSNNSLSSCFFFFFNLLATHLLQLLAASSSSAGAPAPESWKKNSIFVNNVDIDILR